MTIKIIGIILIAVSFFYLIKNPSQSMMDGLMKQRRKMSEKEQAEQPIKAEISEPVEKTEDISDIR